MSLKSKISLEGKVIKTIDEKPVINPNNGLWKIDPDKKEPNGFKVTKLC